MTLFGTILTTKDVSAAKPNFAAVTDPGVGNDNTQGYAVGSIWVNTATGKVYVCTSAATGAAVWPLAATISGGGNILQVIQKEITVNTTASPATWADISGFSQAITTVAGSKLLILISISASAASADKFKDFRFLIDGTPVRGASCGSKSQADEATCCQFMYWKTGLSAASHTVKVQWQIDGGDTGQIRPVTFPNSEHANMVLIEVA